MIRNWLRRLAIDILGKRDFPNWRSAHKKRILSDIREVVILQCNAKLGDAVYLSKTATELIAQKGIKVRVIVYEELVEFWKLYVESENIVCLPKDGYKPTLTKYAKIYTRLHDKKTDCLIYLDSGEQVDGFFSIRLMKCKLIIGCGKSHFRLFDYSIVDPFFRWDTGNYLTKVSDTLAIFGINFQGQLQAHPQSGIPPISTGVVFLNTYSAVPERSFSENQIIFLARYILDVYAPVVSRLFLSVQSGHLQSAVSERLGANEKVIWVCDYSIGQLLGCVKLADFIITPDTGIAHLEGAENCKKLIFYADNYFNPIAWRPSGLVCSAVPKRRQIMISDISEDELKYHVDELFSDTFWRDQLHRG